MDTNGTYAFGTRLPGSLSETRPRVEAALRAGGFGILTEINVAATMKDRLGIDGTPHLILGACNPPLAHRTLEADPSIGALLPCNVVLRELEGATIMEAMDPMAPMALVDSPYVQALATEARESGSCESPRPVAECDVGNDLDRRRALGPRPRPRARVVRCIRGRDTRSA